MRKCDNIRNKNLRKLNELLELYLYLHEDSIPEMTENLKETWNVKTAFIQWLE